MSIIINTEGAVVAEEVTTRTTRLRNITQGVDEAETDIIRTLTRMKIQEAALIAADSEVVAAALAGEVITTEVMVKNSDVEVVEVTETLFTEDLSLRQSVKDFLLFLLGPKTKVSLL